MPNQKAVDQAIVAYTIAQAGATPGVYDNIDDTELSKGTLPYYKQEIHFLTDNQVELGNTDLRRRNGKVVIIIYVRRGDGTGLRDDMYDKMVKCFRSKLIGGATFLNPKLLAKGNTENWNGTAYEIPFYFYEQ